MSDKKVITNVLQLALTTITVFPNFVGNTLVCIVVSKDKSYHTFVNFLLVHLSITDIMVGIFGFAEAFIETFVQDRSSISTGLCKLFANYNLVLIGAFASLLTIIAISIHRYFGIVKPLTSLKYGNTQNLKFVIPVIWVLCLAGFSVRIHKTFSVPGCSKHGKTNAIGGVDFMGNLVGFLGSFITPMIILVYFLLKIITALRKRHEQMRMNSAAQSSILISRKKTTRRLSYVILAFSITVLPFQILILLNGVYNLEDSVLGGVAYSISYCIFLAGSSINPFLYWLNNRKFRESAVRVLKKIQPVAPM